MAPTAADVPYKYDVVFTGVPDGSGGTIAFGCCFADSVESSLPFRTHRAIYDITQTFVERQNVSSGYGDQTQDFFLTLSQNDWSLGEQQKFFRVGDADSKRRYWQGTNVDVTIPGQVTMRQAVRSLTFAENIKCRFPRGSTGGTSNNQNFWVGTTSHMYEVDPVGTITDLGAHGLAGAPTFWGLAGDGSNGYITDGASVRKWSGAAWSTFSASGASCLCYLNNTLFGLINSTGKLVKWDTSGTQSDVYQWKDADGAARAANGGQMIPFGGKLMFLWQDAGTSSELWQYDGSASPTVVAEFPPNFYAWTLCQTAGVLFIGGAYAKNATTAVTDFLQRPAIFYLAGGTLGLAWIADAYTTSSTTSYAVRYPAVSSFDNGVVFNDDTTNRLMYYDLAASGAHGIGAITADNNPSHTVTAGRTAMHLRGSTTSGYMYPNNASLATSSTVISSLEDFDSTLGKAFRGVTVDWTAASDGDGGSVDISYQTDSVSGSFTSLKTGATSGTEYTLPASTTGSAITVKVTLNKGTSTAGPTLKRVYVRAAPQLRQFLSGLYILDFTGTERYPRQLRDGTLDTVTGATLAANLRTAALATTPFTVTDRFGSFTALIDLNDSEGFDIYEVHPPQDAQEGACYLARVKVRGV